MFLESTTLEVRIVRNCREDAPPDSLTAPSAEAAEDSVPIAEDIGPIALGRSGARDPQDIEIAPDTDDSNLRNSHVHQAKCRELTAAPYSGSRGQADGGSLLICFRILAVQRSESPTRSSGCPPMCFLTSRWAIGRQTAAIATDERDARSFENQLTKFPLRNARHPEHAERRCGLAFSFKGRHFDPLCSNAKTSDVIRAIHGPTVGPFRSRDDALRRSRMSPL